RRHGHAIARVVVLGDGLPQRQDAERVRVPRATVLQRLLGRLADHRRRVEIGLAELQVDHVGAEALQRLGAMEDFDGEKRLDGLRAPRDHGRPRAPPAPTRSRAAMTWASIRGPSLATLTREPG